MKHWRLSTESLSNRRVRVIALGPMTEEQPTDHLLATKRLTEQLADHPDRTLVDALVEGFGNLESLIRNQPGDQPIIDAGPLDHLPITKAYITTLENATPNYQVRSDAAAATAGASFVAVKALEVMIQGLAKRTLG